MEVEHVVRQQISVHVEHIVVREQVVVRQLRMEIIRQRREHVARHNVQPEITVQVER